MDLDDLHDMEDTFEVFSDEKKELKTAQIENEKIENNGLTSAKRITPSNDVDVDSRWSKFQM